MAQTICVITLTMSASPPFDPRHCLMKCGQWSTPIIRSGVGVRDTTLHTVRCAVARYLQQHLIQDSRMNTAFWAHAKTVRVHDTHSFPPEIYLRIKKKAKMRAPFPFSVLCH